jgi:hypothetical protein
MHLKNIVSSMIAFLVIAAPSFSQTCPTYTQQTAIAGTAANLPDGWMVFSKSGTNGLFKSSIRTYNGTTTIPNTTSDRATWADISDDGQWIVYLVGASDTSKIYLIKADGTLRTRVPAIVDWEKNGTFPLMPRFFRNSPNGNEIVYVSGGGRIRSTQWTVSGSAVTFSNPRVVFTFPVYDSTTSNGYEWYGWVSGGEGLGIWKDQMIFESFIPATPTTFPPSRSIPGYITIPNNGAGTATRSNFFQWSNSIDSATYGCGHTMSWDGNYCVSNSGWIGNSCVPSKNATKNGSIMDHKGFYVTHFFRAGTAAFDIMTIPTQHGVSINWCPANYQYGNYGQIDFGLWSFSNDTGYVIGVQQGTGTASQPVVKGIWVVNWPTNTWTMISPTTNTTTFLYPALYFPGLSDVKEHKTGMNLQKTMPSMKKGITLHSNVSFITLGKGIHAISIYTMAGKLAWQYQRQIANSTIQISVPRSMQGAGCHVAVFSDAR